MKKKELFSTFDEIDDFSYIDTPTVYIKHKLKKLCTILKRITNLRELTMKKKIDNVMEKIDESGDLPFVVMIQDGNKLKKLDVVLNDKYKSTGENIEIIVDFTPRANVVVLSEYKSLLSHFNHEYNHNHIRGGYYQGSFDDVCIITEIARKIFGIRVKNNELQYVTDSKHFSEDYEKFKKAIKFIDEMLTINREEY
jgi:hypothetical protein